MLKKFFLSKLRSLILILMTVFIIFYVCANGHRDDWLIYYSQSLATLSYIAIVFSAIFVAYQAYLFRKDYEARKERSEFDTAYKLAGYYAKNILPNTNFANEILSKINLKIDKNFYKKSNKFIDFTSIEAQQIFGNDVIEKFQVELYKLDFNKFPFYEYLRTRTPQIQIKREWDKFLSGNQNQPKNKKNVYSDAEQFYVDKKNELINNVLDVLNEFEYFAMYFCSGLAAPDTVYMSIHQTYLEFMMNNYLLICSQNDKPGHEYYTHAVQLYKDWTEISNKKDMERNDALAKINSPEKPKKTHS